MVNSIDLLSDGEFTELIKHSTCAADVLKKLGYTTRGNSWGYNIIADRMDKLGIYFGEKFTCSNGDFKTIPLQNILTVDSNYNRNKLRIRLIKEGLKENKCEICGATNWLGKPLSLHLHHLNGIHNDNRLSNLQILCPNCHFQTENFGTKGRGRILKKKCLSLPIEIQKEIMKAVSELGIVQARKILPYRNSLINSVVKLHREVIIMICPDGKEVSFNTSLEASRYLYNKYNIGSNPESNRPSISRCYNNRQDNIKGFKFIKRSAEL